MKKQHYTTSLQSFIIVILLSFTSALFAQEDIDILEKYEDYVDNPREVVYLHLNKSTYIKGESVGFKAYVLDKNDKKPSLLTTNLYVTVEDSEQNIIKSKLVRVFDGTSSNIIEIDSSFNTGLYTIKAYTNWLRNFNEQNYFIETIKVIDPQTDTAVSKINAVSSNIDAQFLPESGHLLANVVNNIGVVIKGENGLGIANIVGKVIDSKGNPLTTFKTNRFGISNFSLLPNLDTGYKATFSFNDKDYTYDISKGIKSTGVLLSFKRQQNKGVISIFTNDQSLDQIKGKRFTLLIHNGKDYTSRDIYFTDNNAIVELLNYDACPAGTNIITLLNEDDIPIAERLFFNYEGINIIGSNSHNAERDGDSIDIKLNYNKLNPSQIQAVSASILPEDTQSYFRHHNLVSYTLLQPYINGTIENAKYYFKDISERKKYELDNLLVTQGWSSYDWNQIFNEEEKPLYAFEQGILLKANASSNQGELKYMIMATPNIEPNVFEYNKIDNAYYLPNIFATDNDNVYISKVNSNEKFSPADIYLQTIPSSIPYLKSKNLKLPVPEINVELNSNAVAFDNLDGVEILDEVLVTSYIDKIRIRTRELSEGRFGQIKVVTEFDRNTYFYLSDFLRANRVTVNEDRANGSVQYFGGRSTTVDLNGIREVPMTVYYNDAQLIETNFLFNVPLSEFDYVEINRSGIGGGARGNGGELKLYTSNKSVYSNRWLKTSRSFDLPLKFSTSKTYYVPQYRYKNDEFFEAYGVVDWKPILKIDENGILNMRIAKPQVPITLFIEGITDDGSFIFEETSIDLN